MHLQCQQFGRTRGGVPNTEKEFQINSPLFMERTGDQLKG